MTKKDALELKYQDTSHYNDETGIPKELCGQICVSFVPSLSAMQAKTIALETSAEPSINPEQDSRSANKLTQMVVIASDDMNKDTAEFDAYGGIGSTFNFYSMNFKYIGIPVGSFYVNGSNIIELTNSEGWEFVGIYWSDHIYCCSLDADLPSTLVTH